MGKCIKRLAISIIAAAFSLLTLSGPVFATNTGTNSSEQASFSVSTNILTTFATSTTPENSQGSDNENTNNSETCYDQVGGIGWLICPGTSFLANVIDGAYDILEQLIRVNPVSTDENAPIHVVWNYLKNITNVVFVIFFLVIIYSQITGFGINNYGIKRTLPRIIVAAILVNLSYLICILAVDVSNILGVGFRGIFQSIQADAIANSTISEAAANTSVAGIVATILGVGTIGTIGALTIAGGWTGLIWLLIPVILSGAIAIISAVVTMAARQALILLLIMISPLAFVAYLLPNTERWYKMWVNMFARMLFFYPMFSILYGASQLSGLVIITSATNWLGVVLGIAVQVLPLFMSVPLMRMSGTILGRVDGLVRRAGAPIRGAAIRRSTEGRILAKQRQLASTSYRPSTRLAQYLEQRRLNRKLDTDEAIEVGHKQRLANYNRSMYNRNGQLSNRGLTRYRNIQRNIDANNVITTTSIDFDEGFKDDGTDVRVRAHQRAAIAATNAAITRGVDIAAINKARQRSVDLENVRSRAERIREGVKDQRSEIHRQITSSFNLRNTSNDPAEKAAIQKSINATLSDAITDSRKVDKVARDSYYELYDDMPAGNGPQTKLVEAFAEKDYNSMVAAISVMAKRGDFKDIQTTLFEHSGEIADDMRMQKQLADELITKKQDDQILWAYAKANMIRRGMYTTATSEGKTAALDPFIDFKTFIGGKKAPGDNIQTKKDNDKFVMTSMDKILEDVKGAGTTATQDRTVFKAMLEFMRSGDMPANTLHIPMKYIRSAAVSGLMDGEQLGTLNKYITFGYDPSGDATENAFFDANKALVEQNIESFFKDMAASQLVNIKSSTFNALNQAMLAIDPASATTATTGDPNNPVSQKILDALHNQIESVNKPNYTARGGMNPNVRVMLGIHTDM